MKVRGRRYLLNAPGIQSTAAVVCELEDTRGWEDGCDRYGQLIERSYEAEPKHVLQFANCDRSINFELGWHSAAERRNSLAKVDRMIAALSVFRAALAEEQRIYVSRTRHLS